MIQMNWRHHVCLGTARTHANISHGFDIFLLFLYEFDKHICCAFLFTLLLRPCSSSPALFYPKFDSDWVILLAFSFSRLSLEDTQQWSQSLERLLDSKCRFDFPLGWGFNWQISLGKKMCFKVRNGCRCSRWTGYFSHLSQVRVQRWEHWILAHLWGLQEDQVFIQNVLESQEDLWAVHQGWIA